MSYMLPRTFTLHSGITIVIDQICAIENGGGAGGVKVVMASGDKYPTEQTYIQFMNAIDKHVKDWDEIRAIRQNPRPPKDGLADDSQDASS